MEVDREGKGMELEGKEGDGKREEGGGNVNWREFVSSALGGLDAVDCGCLLKCHCINS